MPCTIKEDFMKKTVKTETIVRTVLLVLALINFGITNYVNKTAKEKVWAGDFIYIYIYTSM